MSVMSFSISFPSTFPVTTWYYIPFSSVHVLRSYIVSELFVSIIAFQSGDSIFVKYKSNSHFKILPETIFNKLLKENIASFENSKIDHFGSRISGPKVKLVIHCSWPIFVFASRFNKLGILQKSLNQLIIHFYTIDLAEWCYSFYHYCSHSNILRGVIKYRVKISIQDLF